MPIEITQVYERYTSYSNDAERGDVLHRCLFGEHCRPEQLVAADFDLKDYRISIDRSVPCYTYYRLYPKPSTVELVQLGYPLS